MSKYLAVVSLFLGSLFFSQSTSAIQFAKFDLGLNGIGLSYEHAISHKWVWENSLGYGGGTSIIEGSCSGYSFSTNALTPFIKSDIRYFYNQDKRIAKNKNPDYNSGNYISFQLKYSFGKNSTDDLNRYIAPGINYGIQRSLGKGFLFNAQAGAVLINDIDSKHSELLPNINIKFSYVLF